MFEQVPAGPADPFYHLKKKADEDTHPDKVDIGVGIYRSEQGTYQELAVVKKAGYFNPAKKIVDERNLGHDYGLTVGDAKFLELAAGVIFGENSELQLSNRIASVQTLSGSGANHLAATLLSRSVQPKPTVYVSRPGWANNEPLCIYAGLETVAYEYLDAVDGHSVDLAGCLAAIQSAPRGSVFIFQGCCHNPSGRDLTPDQWQKLAVALQARGHLPFLDFAYQGLGNGLEEDAVGVRTLAATPGLDDFVVCQSFAKNFALYGERCGALHIVTATAQAAANVRDQLRSLIRREYSSPPAYGARLVTAVLSDPELRQAWTEELQVMRSRLKHNRSILRNELETVKAPGNWEHITEENGLFCCLPLTAEQCEDLINHHHIHLPPSGRINVAGLSAGNIKRTALAINTVLCAKAQEKQ